MLSDYSLNAEFESIEAPELIAASLYILKKESWKIKYYSDLSIEAEKATINNQKAKLTLLISKNEVDIQCLSELAEDANKFIVDHFAEDLHKFITTSGFDSKIKELKHHYFMNNPLENPEEISSIASESFLKSIFKFRKGFRVTPIIFILNFLVFVAMSIMGASIMMPDTIEVIKWGGNSRTLVLQGDWWRLITCCFIHYGLIHILLNMWALYNIGIFLERMIGGWRFGFAYIIAGLAGSLNSIVFHYDSASAGASGAIFGMFGLFLALLTTNVLEKEFRKAMLKSVLPMILLNLVIGSSIAVIDNAGHMGGLIAGIICGYLFAWHYKKPKSISVDLISFLLPVLLIAAYGFIVQKNLPDYQGIENEISKLEVEALKIEKLGSNDLSTHDVQSLWDKAILDAKKLVAVDFNEDINLRHEQLLFYLQKRKEEAYFLYRVNDSLIFKQKRYTVDSVLKLLNEKPE